MMRIGPRRYMQNCQDAAYYEGQIESILNLSGKRVFAHLRSNGVVYSLIGTLLEDLGEHAPKDPGLSIPYQARQYMELYHYMRRQSTLWRTPSRWGR